MTMEQALMTVSELITILQRMPQEAVVIPFDTVGPGETVKVVVDLGDNEVRLSVKVVPQ
jgi:hypothetical protein